MGLFTTFRWVPSTMSRITKLKLQVDGLPFFRNSAHGRPLQAKRSRWPVFVARHQKNHPIAKSSQNSPVPNQLPCPAGRERVRYTERLARSMGSDDDMFRIWSGPEGSSHKEPLSGIRIHRAHYFCAVLPNRAMLDAARHPGRQFVIQKAGHDQKVNALLFHANLFALDVARWRCQNIGGPLVRTLRGNVSLVLGFACGIARLPNALPALAGCQPKPPEGSHLSI